MTSYIIGCYVFLNTNKDILLKVSLCPLSAKYFLELRSHGNQTNELIQDLKKQKHLHVPVCVITTTKVKQHVHSVKKWQLVMLEYLFYREPFAKLCPETICKYETFLTSVSSP